MKYTLIPHTADMGIRVRHRTLPGLFRNAAFALFDILTGVARIKSQFHKTISVQAVNTDELLNEFLNRLLQEFTVENNLIRRVAIKTLTPNSLSAVIYGEPFDPKRHHIKIEIKAITFNDLYVKKGRNGYEAQVILDV